MIARCGVNMPNLEFVVLGLGDLTCSSDQPNAEQVEHFRLLYNDLMAEERNDFSFAKKNGTPFKTRLVKNLYFNYVPMNQAIQWPFSVKFSKFHFDKPFVVCYYRNCLKDLKLISSATIHTIEYLGVLDTFSICEDPNEVINLTGEEPSLAEPNHGFGVFVRQFPQVRRVTLFRNRHREQIQPELFLSFLREFKSLTIMELYCPGFDNATFYDHLAKLTCLHTLATLRIVDRRKELVSFGFLSKFSYLYEFYTNLMTPEKAPALIETMRAGCRFTFDYLHPEHPYEYDQVVIKKVTLTEYEVTLVERKQLDPEFRRQHVQETMHSAHSAMKFLEDQNLLKAPHLARRS